MQALTHLFPATDFSLLAVILGLPLLAAFINGVFGKRLGREAVTLMALLAMGSAFLASLGSFLMLLLAQVGEQSLRFSWFAWDWFSIGGQGPTVNDPRSIQLEVAFSIDALSAVLSLVITGVGFLVHLYSMKYMAQEARYFRFISYLNLFIFMMLVLVLGDSLPILFVGWQGAGLCSYLLIAFSNTSELSSSAAKKAFILGRLGDVALLVAMGLLAYFVGALDWTGIERGEGNLLQTVKVWPVGESVPIAAFLPEEWALFLNTPRYLSAALLVGGSLLLAALARSAQFGLHLWLPEAMAAPTPASALLHAGTMLSGGVYLLCRLSGILVLSPLIMALVAGVGALTAFFAASVALVQHDIKKVLAYSAISQFGFIFLGLGVGAFSAAFYHLLTQAFFMTCLFLGAGSVVHAIRPHLRDTGAAQDLRNLGGLRSFQPLTFLSFGAASAAAVALPFTSGFFSLGEVLIRAKTSYVAGAGEILGDGGRDAVDSLNWAPWYGTLLYSFALAAVLLTAFYMSRLFIGIFFGDFKAWKIVEGSDNPEEGAPEESPWQMTVPLAVLGFLSLIAGVFQAHFLFDTQTFAKVVAPVFAGTSSVLRSFDGTESFRTLSPLIFTFVAVGGVSFAIWTSLGAQAKAKAEPSPAFSSAKTFLYKGWRISEFYDKSVVGAVESLAEHCLLFERWAVDALLVRFPAFALTVMGSLLRQFQTGRLHSYGAISMIGLIAVAWYIVAPQTNVRRNENHGTGRYAIVAAPGFGYSYRWDSDGDAGGWDEDEFGETLKLNFSLEPDTTRSIRLQVKNALGHVREERFEFTRPPLAVRPLFLERGADGRLRRRGTGANEDEAGQRP